MLPSLELLEKQVSKTDQQLIYHLILEQRETNRLLRKLVGEKTDAVPVESVPESTESVAESIDFDSLKRPDLMKLMSKHPNKPQGWNKWENDQMVEFLKGAKG